MDSATQKVLEVRSLNATRLLHEVSYVATRFLLDAEVLKHDSHWAHEILARKYPIRARPRFFRVLRFKRVREPKQFEYREFLIPSPTTSLTEALVLDSLSRSPAFAKREFVYSYRWPAGNWYPYNFQHYIRCYRARNRAISNFMRNNPERLAVILDIERFYENIPHRTVRARFERGLHASDLPAQIVDTASQLVDHLASGFENRKGIATGPSLSHVLGDLSLSELDSEMAQRFPSAYFRYVDDIVVVVKPSEKSSVEQLVKDLLDREGLTVNLEKTDHVSSDEWLDHGPHKSAHKADVSFERLVFRIKCYLSIYPSRYSELEQLFSDNGFGIPLRRILAASRSGSFAVRLSALIKRGWNIAWTALFDTEKSILESAQVTKHVLGKRLESLVESDLPSGGSRRRWHLQRLRYLTNRYLYLTPAEDLKFLRGPIGDISEFAETSALLDFLIDGKTEDLLEMPGPAVAAAGQMIKQRRSGFRIRLPNALSKAAIHSASTLLLYDACEKPEIDERYTDSQKQLLWFASGQAAEEREREDFTYLDEIRTLQLGRGPSDAREALETRFADLERSIFEGLFIGDNYFS